MVGLRSDIVIPCRCSLSLHKLLQLNYLVTIALVSDEMNVTACEGDGISIHCRGDATIKITSAVFGRLSFAVCKPYNQNTWTKFCRAKQALNVVKQTCEGRSSCFVYANTGVFGEPCLGLEKYLQVTYRCKSRI